MVGGDESFVSHLASLDAELLVLKEDRINPRHIQLLREFNPDIVVVSGSLWESLGLDRVPAACGIELAPSSRKPNGGKKLLNSCPAGEYRINDRLLQVLVFLRGGLQNAEIAKLLGVSVRTVKGYFNQLFRIFDVTNRTELVASAIGLGIFANAATNGQNLHTAESPPLSKTPASFLRVS